MLGPYRAAADIIEQSGLNYTILRPAWLTDADEVSYEITQKDEPCKGTEVSRKSVAALVTDIITHSQRHLLTSNDENGEPAGKRHGRIRARSATGQVAGAATESTGSKPTAQNGLPKLRSPTRPLSQ